MDDPKYKKVAMFKCPVKSQYYEANDLEEASFVVFKSDLIAQRPKSVVISSQAGGILHKINYTLNFDSYTFFYGTLASLVDVIEYTDFRKQPLEDLEDSGNTTWQEDIPSDDLIKFLSNYTSNVNRIFKIDTNDTVIYKCIGQQITDSNNTKNNSVISTFLLVKLTNSTQNLAIDDYIYGDASNGFLERVISLDRIRTVSNGEKLVIQSELVQCISLSEDDLVEQEQDDFEVFKKSDLNCEGGINSKLSLLIVESSNLALNQVCLI